MWSESNTCALEDVDPQVHLLQRHSPLLLGLQVNYKSDLNWIKGVGWTPPGSHKAELARRAAELGLAEGCSTDEAIAKYQNMMMVSQEVPSSPG